MPGSESALVVIKATQTGYPLGKAVWKHLRYIRRAAAKLSFWEVWRAGLLASYQDRDEALPDILQSVSTSTAIRILSNKGDDWLGQHGRLSPTIRQLKGSEKKPLVKTLLMHRAAPWINGYAHGYSGKDLAVVREDYAVGHLSVCRFCEELGLPAPRFHKQAAAWRFVMTDDKVFVSTYDVIDHIGGGQVDCYSSNSILYKSLKVQFEYTYDLQASEAGELNALERLSNKAVDFKESAGLVCTHIEGGVRRVLVIEKDGAVVLPKGGIKIDEVAAESAFREFREETGFAVKPIELRLVGAYVTGQPFFSTVDVKAIAYFHAHEPLLVQEEVMDNVRWLDSASLATVQFAYDHIPEVLRKCGMAIR